MNRFLATVSVLLAMVLGSCGSSDGTGADTSVALLTAGPVSDAGWHAGAYDGLQRIGDSLGVAVSHQQTRTAAEFDDAFSSYAESGYDLIFAHGFEYQDAATRAGERFPDVTFVVSAGSRPGPNVVPLIFRLEEASYLAGMAAGALTATGTIGMVGGVEIPSAKGTFVAFEAGARATNPGVTVLETFTGNWEDVSAAKEAAVAQLRRGADVLIHNVDAASFGVFQAVREARQGGSGVWAMGMNNDQNDVAPDVVLGSAVIDIPGVFLQVARAWQAGTLEGPLYTGLAAGAVSFVPNPALLERYSPELLSHLQAAADSIAGGMLDVPRVPFVEGETTS
ncbi:MAG: BMP family protein [Gemmatimonadota bacterium]|nr:BMP family protein [Gemmatimonadota bacterium]